MKNRRKLRHLDGDVDDSPTTSRDDEDGVFVSPLSNGNKIHGRRRRGSRMERKILLWWTGLILVSVFTGYYLFFRQYFPVAPANETESSFPNGSSDLTSVEVLTSLLASEDDDQSAPNELHFPLAINEESLKNLLSPVRIFPNTVHLGTNDLTNSYFFKIHPLLHNRGRPEYNDLDLNHDDYVNANRFQRSIFFETDDQNDEDDKGVSEAWVDDYYLQYDERDYPRECIMPAWTDLHFPVCNIFHESMTQERFSKSESIRYLASGYYRDTFLWKSTVAHSSDGDFVFKRLRFCAEHNFTPSIGDQMRTEALIMERLSASPRITQIYGYCATSLAVEVGKEITKDIVPFVPELQYERGRVPQSDLDELQKLHQTEIYSFNNFTAEEKLDIAIQVAEAVAEMHGFAGSVIVNDDVHPDQWLQVPTATGRRLILNDMNNAGFLKWNPVKQEYCKYYRKFGGDFHAPEEFVGDYVDEQTDIWSIGNMVFILLTGLWPYYDIPYERRDELQALAIAGELPYINPAYRRHSLIEFRLVELMKLCYKREPDDRIDIFEVVRHLRHTKFLLEQDSEREQL